MDIKTQYRKNIDLFIWGIIACLWDFEITQTTTGQISFVGFGLIVRIVGYFLLFKFLLEFKKLNKRSLYCLIGSASLFVINYVLSILTVNGITPFYDYIYQFVTVITNGILVLVYYFTIKDIICVEYKKFAPKYSEELNTKTKRHLFWGIGEVISSLIYTGIIIGASETFATLSTKITELGEDSEAILAYIQDFIAANPSLLGYAGLLVLAVIVMTVFAIAYFITVLKEIMSMERIKTEILTYVELDPSQQSEAYQSPKSEFESFEADFKIKDEDYK